MIYFFRRIDLTSEDAFVIHADSYEDALKIAYSMFPNQTIEHDQELLKSPTFNNFAFLTTDY